MPLLFQSHKVVFIKLPKGINAKTFSFSKWCKLSLQFNHFLSVLGLIFLVHSIPFAGLLSVYKDDLNYHTLNAEHLQNKSKGDVIEQTITHCALPLSPLSLSRSLEARALSTFPTTPPPHQLPLFALSLPLHAAAAAAATLLLGAPAAAAVGTPLPPTGPAPAPPTVEPGFVVVAVVVVAPFVADAVGVVAAAADVVVAAAGPPGMCGLLFISQLARCLCRSSSILVRCIPSPDSFKVSFIIAINQTEKKMNAPLQRADASPPSKRMYSNSVRLAMPIFSDQLSRLVRLQRRPPRSLLLLL